MIKVSLQSEFEKWLKSQEEYLHDRRDIKIQHFFEGSTSSDQREKGVLNFEHELFIMQIEVWGHGNLDASLLQTEHGSLDAFYHNFATNEEFIDHISSLWRVMLENTTDERKL